MAKPNSEIMSHDSDDETASTLSLPSSPESSRKDFRHEHIHHRHHLPPMPQKPMVSRRISFTGLPSDPYLVLDRDHSGHGEDTSRGHLLLKVEGLLEQLKGAEVDVSAERIARRKKEKNLRKLARELNKRFVQSNEDAKCLNQMEETLKRTEQELALANYKLEQQNNLHKQALEEHRMELEHALVDAHDTYTATCAEHDARIMELSKVHSQQYHELCNELVKAHQEADRLRMELQKETEGNRTVSKFCNLLLSPLQLYSFHNAWDVICKSCEDAVSPTRKNGHGFPIGAVARQLFR